MSYSNTQGSRMSHGGGGGGSAVGLRVRGMQRAAPDYKQGINDGHVWTCFAAERLAKQAGLEQLLLRTNNRAGRVGGGKENTAEETEEALQWLSAHRKRLKTLAEATDERAAQIQTFLDVLTQVSQQEESEDGSTAVAYEDLIGTAMKEKHLQQRRRSHNYTPQGAFYAEVCDKLGEPIEQPRAGRRGGDDDDDLEVLPPTQEGAQASLKCPISTQLLEHPVRSTVCRHVYSRDQIRQQIQYNASKRKACKCPVPGCANDNVTMDQLQEDKEMEYKVRRERKKAETLQQQSRRMAHDLDEDEDEDDDPHHPIRATPKEEE
jgi:E3 SUMO-protein ligase NSE2